MPVSSGAGRGVGVGLVKKRLKVFLAKRINGGEAGAVMNCHNEKLMAQPTNAESSREETLRSSDAGFSLLQRLVRARGQASREGMALCLKWIDSCREMGWAEDQFNDLEDLFWKYRDPDGRLRPNAGTERA